MKHLLLFSLGPVQSFIAQARKTHDLYAGSMLLSHLVNTAIGTVGEKHLIFPKKGEAMPNRFLAEVPETETDLQAFGERVENAVRTEWAEIANTALKGIPQKPAGFDEQVAGFLEIFWVIEPLESEDRYQETVALLEKNLTAVKNVRPFIQYAWQDGIIGEQGRKCSLDGQRNVLFYRPKNGFDRSETGSPLYTTPGSVYISQHFPPGVILQPGEGLSAVSFIKRRYRPVNTPDFESTAEIALMDVLSKLVATDKTGELKTCIGLIRNLNAQLFYEENISGDALLKYLREAGVQEASADSYKKCSDKVRDAAKRADLRMMKYYAILTFDGDDMGKWLSGESLKDQSHLREFQGAFATCLADFAKEATRHLNNGSGQTVYAGGDDFLGFVNLNHLLPVVKRLRLLFHEKVDIPLQKFKKPDAGKIAFSAGICVAHYKEPLSLVLQEAKSAQKKAKELDKKDAFAIAVIKGSGESHIAALPFGENAENVEQLQALTQALIREDFSNNFIKTARLEFERVVDFKSTSAAFAVFDDFEEVFKTELRRLLNRSSNQNDKEQRKEEVNKMTSLLMKLLGDRSAENFFQMLHIADFFQREMDAPKAHQTSTTQTI
jgi:CRISPR-associated protein Cmr2